MIQIILHFSRSFLQFSSHILVSSIQVYLFFGFKAQVSNAHIRSCYLTSKYKFNISFFPEKKQVSSPLVM